jgi:hypothetical protein
VGDVDYRRAVATYGSAVNSFVALIHEIPAERWDGPGLGDWDLRSLVGHASRSLITVITYLDTSAEREDIATPQEYYMRAKEIAAADPSGVVERGRKAGRDLGADPVAAIDDLSGAVLTKLAASDDRLIAVIGGMGIRLRQYLPTRTFELAVHGLDIAAAADVRITLPDDVQTEATALAAQTAVALGQGEAVLMALTGRTPLPPSFSVV